MSSNSRLAAFVVAGSLIACPALADHLPDDKLAAGKPETTLCGFDPYNTLLKDILAKLGEPEFVRPTPSDKINVTYHWSRGPLQIQVNAYQVDGYLDRPPVYIEVAGRDPDGFCRTGRGLALGSSLGDLRKIYGTRYGVRSTGDGRHTVTLQWPDLATLFVRFDKAGRVQSVNLPGESE